MNPNINIPLKQPLLGDEEKKAIIEVLDSGVIAQGKKVAEFEDRFSELCGAKYAVAVNSGTAALHAILAGLNIGQGDEVIVTSFSFIATASPILMVGAKPVFADIDLENFNIDPDSIEPLINDKTKAIIAVNLYGYCANWKVLNKIAKKHNLFLLEDSAQAHGASYEDSVAGNNSDAAWFSFYATKNMTTGEGGMITTNNEELAINAKRFRQHGMNVVGNYEYIDLGFNYRTTDLQASIGIQQLRKLESWNNRRKDIATEYLNSFCDNSSLILPKTKIQNHVYHLFTMRTDSAYRDQIVEKISKSGVGCGVYYPQPLYNIPYLSQFRPLEPNINSELAADSVFSIPCEPYMSDSQVLSVIQIVNAATEDLEG